MTNLADLPKDYSSHDIAFTAAAVHHWPYRTREQISGDIDSALADIAPLGQFALANPDVVDRLRRGAPLNAVEPTTLYGGGEAGYTDYPTLAHV